MTDEMSVASTLTLSTRDVQWLAAIMEIGATLLSDTVTERELQFNLDAIETLFVAHYSGTEGNALAQRVRALLPPDTLLKFVEPRRKEGEWIQ